MAPATHTLTRPECEALLTGQGLGRIAVSTPQGPHIVPVRYLAVDAEPGPGLIAPIGTYSVLGTYADGAMLAFEVDGVDAVSGASWSVVGRGRGELLRHPPEVWRTLVTAWTAGPRNVFLLLRPAELSGRRDPVPLAL